MEFVDVGRLTVEQVSELITRYAPEPTLVVIVNGKVIELGDKE